MENSPTDKKAITEKIKNGDVKVKGKGTHVGKAAEPKQPKANATAEPKKPKRSRKEKPGSVAFTDEQFIEALRKIGRPATSREVSDALGIENPEFGRQLVRTRMKKLAEGGKVIVKEATSLPKGIKGDKVYSVT